jgi:FkbM family methyltransferase
MEQLEIIHSKLNFTGNIQTEIPEQLMTAKHILPDDCVLELGGSIGRNSCVINSILTDKTKHVVIEPSKAELNILLKNRESNNLGFQVENSAISNKQLYSKHWYTFEIPVEGSVPVNCITYNDFKQKYNLPFNVLVVDNEGNFVKMMKDSIDILDNIRMIIIEHDFNTEDDYEYFKRTLKNKGFECKDTYSKIEKYGPGMRWPDGLQSDPIFVSVWKSS